MAMRPLSLDYVREVVQAGLGGGQTFDALVAAANAAQYRAGPDVLRVFLDQLVRDREVAPHPMYPDRYVHRDHYPPRLVHVVEPIQFEGRYLPTYLHTLGPALARANDRHTAAVQAGEAAIGAVAPLTLDHVELRDDGERRWLAIYDRPIFPRRSVTVDRPIMQGP
jgi:hypothetical protein